MRSVPSLLFAFLVLVGIAIGPGYVDNVDSRIILRTAERLVDAGTWDMGDVGGTYLGSPDYGARGPDGSHQMKFGPGNALLDVPFVVGARALLVPLGLPPEQASEAGASLAPALWFGLIGLFAFAIARRFLPEAAAVAAVLTGLLATYAVVYAKSSYLEVPTTAAVLGGYVAALRVREKGRVADGLALGAACVAVLWIKFAVLALLAGLVPIFRRGDAPRLRPFLAAAAVFLAGLGAFLWLNHVRFGSPFATGYATSVRFWSPLGDGVLELLTSPRGGLLPYAPFLVLALPGIVHLARTRFWFAAEIALTTTAAMVLYGTWCSPLGGDVWGARYLLPIVPLLALPASVCAHRLWTAGGWRRAAVASLVAFSAAVQVPPVLVSFQEIYSLRPHWAGRDDAPDPQRLSARILAEKFRTTDGTYDLGRLGLPAGRHTPGRVERGLNLWPVRVAEDLPSRAALGYVAWGAIVAGAAVAAALLARRAREPS